MLFCKKCQVEHEEDKRFCPTCGTFLIRKEALTPEVEHQEEQVEEQPREKFICPDCKIIYEKTKTCIRCGVAVVPVTSLEKKEPAEPVRESEAKEGSSQVVTTREWLDSAPEPLICPACKKEHLGGKSCMRCGTALVSPDALQKTEKVKPPPPPNAKKKETITPLPPEGKKDLFQDELPEQLPPKKTVQEQIKQGRFLRKVKKDYPRMVLNWSGVVIICVAAGYLLWSTYTHVLKPQTESETSLPSKETILPSPLPSSPVPISHPSPPSEAEEQEKIRDLLEKIRKANLGKDIDLFLSCYAKDFKDREGKKKSALESWENFNFLDLTFQIGRFSLTGNLARARVEWLAKFAPKGGGQPQESKTAIDVLFKKEDGDWKIGEIKSSL